jgi:hypothetical protein
MSRHYPTQSLAFMVLLSGLAASPVQADVVTDWNSVALDAVIAAREAQPTQARSVAMVHVAMFEAINAIEQRYRPYVVKVSPSPSASREAAAAAAAHAILTKLYPGQIASFDKALTSSLSQIPDGEAKRSGLSLGKHAGLEVYDTRAAEMANSANAYRPRTTPGVYVSTTLPVATEAARFKPWLMQEPAQFRPAAPIPLQSAQWARDYNEIKEMGGRDSKKRSSEQTAVGQFWIVTGPPAWNPVIRALVATKSEGASRCTDAMHDSPWPK